MKPVTVSIDVPQGRDHVFAFLDVMANHEVFTDHMMVDWTCSGPPAGVGAKAHVTSTVGGRRDSIDIEVVSADPGVRITERNIGAHGRRVAHGTYTLLDRPGGGTRIVFEYAWQQAPPVERLLAPAARAMLRRELRRALDRLRAALPSDDASTAESHSA